MKKKATTKASTRKRNQARRSERVTSVTSEEARLMRGRTDWARVDALTDEEIDAAIASDPDSAPAFDRGFLARAAILMPPVGAKKPIAFRVDPDVLEFFKRRGPGYQGRMNAVLRAFMQSRS
jgi:uncharacterized protein (DUF4415 family)